MIMPETPQDERYVNHVYTNTKSNFIQVTEDKLIIILTELIKNIKESSEWLMPMSIFLSLVVTVLTTEFNKNFLGISKSIWCALFYISMVISAYKFLRMFIRSKNNKDETSINYVLKKIKNSEE